ncbi:MAG: hypothetical protein H7A15_09090 [Sinobacteraceae bacterium]|nr:hypothetical protein [Nevskiaceae bacterium]
MLLVVPDLPPSGAAACAPSAMPAPALARLRFGGARRLRGGWRSWLAARCGRPDLDGLPLAAVVAAALPRPISAAAVTDSAASKQGDTSNQGEISGSAWLATPLHLVAGLDTVHLRQDGIVRLDVPEREALAAGFAAALGGGRLQLSPAGAEAFVLQGLDLDAVQTVEPVDCLGGSLADAQPSGPGAVGLRRLMSEIEMWLHEHPVNLQRVARGARPVNALWLWGGAATQRPAIAGFGAVAAAGAGRRPVPDAAADAVPDGVAAIVRDDTVPQCVYADDAWTRAVVRLAGLELAPEGVTPDPAAFALAGDALVVARWHAADPPDAAAFEARFLEPALAALRRGALGRLTLVTAGRVVTVEAGDRFRWWRPRRDWLTALEV